ncbi:hypothetical protein HMPREF0653_01337 [Prevotella disiens JCM 6334 = ATCC 29426]|uniref:Uncharacterized protein n=1 Tax=Prevotella disiens JCM 6334 = ATCC 29426 TaxID=1235811 RepID=A0ABP2Y7R3_9BACT|nr:hypothetical protein HMPREF0653_01337 [Prevotella disiens JCM 6334 = ATCC 29426]
MPTKTIKPVLISKEPILKHKIGTFAFQNRLFRFFTIILSGDFIKTYK